MTSVIRPLSYDDIDEWEMYDLENDPDEMNNLYDDASYKAVKEKLHKLLDKTLRQYKDMDPQEKTRVLFNGNRRKMDRVHEK